MDLEVLTREMRKSSRNAALESTIFVKLRLGLRVIPESGHRGVRNQDIT
jgi:hypothetical protein